MGKSKAEEFVDSLSEHANKGRHLHRAVEEMLAADPTVKQVPCIAVLFDDSSVVVAAYPSTERIEILAT